MISPSLHKEKVELSKLNLWLCFDYATRKLNISIKTTTNLTVNATTKLLLSQHLEVFSIVKFCFGEQFRVLEEKLL